MAGRVTRAFKRTREEASEGGSKLLSRCAAQESEEPSDRFEVKRFNMLTGKRVFPAGSIWGPQVRAAAPRPCHATLCAPLCMGRDSTPPRRM